MTGVTPKLAHSFKLYTHSVSVEYFLMLYTDGPAPAGDIDLGDEETVFHVAIR